MHRNVTQTAHWQNSSYHKNFDYTCSTTLEIYHCWILWPALTTIFSSLCVMVPIIQETLGESQSHGIQECVTLTVYFNVSMLPVENLCVPPLFSCLHRAHTKLCFPGSYHRRARWNAEITFGWGHEHHASSHSPWHFYSTSMILSGEMKIYFYRVPEFFSFILLHIHKHVCMGVIWRGRGFFYHIHMAFARHWSLWERQNYSYNLWKIVDISLQHLPAYKNVYDI